MFIGSIFYTNNSKYYKSLLKPNITILKRVPVKTSIVITKLTENEDSSVIPYSLSNASISVFGAEENIQFCNFTFGTDNYQQYNATGLPQTISDFPEILSFSMPIDGNITNIHESLQEVEKWA